jgi:hypothetical protein
MNASQKNLKYLKKIMLFRLDFRILSRKPKKTHCDLLVVI